MSDPEPDGMRGTSIMDAGTEPLAPIEALDPANPMLPNPVLPGDVPFDSEPQDVGASPATAVMRESCYTGSMLAKRKRLDMYIVMDANVTLPYAEAWSVATTGVREFVQDQAAQGIGVGLRYYGTECDADPYNVNPTVEVGVLPGNEAALVEGIKTPTDYNASPMAFALEGGIMHQKRRAEEHPEWTQIVVLITDGFTQDLTCRYTLQDVEQIADAGYNGDPQIATYVIGFGAPDTMSTIADEVIARFSVLNGIASDGGGKLFSVKYNDSPSDMHDALTSIRRMAQPCAYEVPEDMDPDKLNLVLLPGSFVPRVDSREKCGQATPGFFYEPVETDAPTTLQLCPASCWSLQRSDYAAVLFTGCPTVRRD